MSVTRRSFLVLTGGVAAEVILGSPLRAQAAPAAGVGGDTALVSQVGYIDGDLNPAHATLAKYGVAGRAAFDYQYRSFGFDFGAPVSANAIEIVNESTSHGLTSRDFTVWGSDDNSTWTKVSGSRIVDLGASVWVLFPETTVRFLKVHCTREYDDVANTTFVLASLSRDVRAHHLEVPALIAGNGGVWQYAAQANLTNPTDETLRDRAAYLSWDDLHVTAQTDLRSIRFADAEGAYLHAYADADGIYVRIPSIAPGQQQTITVYSGNTAATDTVHVDIQALQVEYGQRTLTRHSPDLPNGSLWANDTKAVRIGSGLLMLAAGAGAFLGARYSSDEGRTFGDVETLMTRSAGRSGISMGSCYTDPETGLTVLVYYELAARSGTDWMSETSHSCHCMVVRAENYDDNGRPVFGTPQRLMPVARNLGIPSSWALTYCNPVRTLTGALLLPVAHVVEHESSTFAVSVFRSTDDGITWAQNESSLEVPGTGSEAGVSETAIQVLDNGSILLFARQQGPTRYYYLTTVSHDDGLTWDPVADSDILASNTMPWLSRDRDSHLVLGWSGHNAQGQTSYHRNNLTVAWSGDEGTSFNGYHDLLGATSHTISGAIGDPKRVVESDTTRSGTKDQLFSWSTLSTAADTPFGGPHTMLVEDYEDYIGLSHGALDLVQYRKSSGVAEGSELGYSRWWRITEDGVLAPGPGARPQRSAVRLTVSKGQGVGASRLFPAIRTGSVRFLLRPAVIGAGVRLLLQEGWSNKLNARGTVVSLQLAPDGRLLATEDHTLDPITPLVGYAQDPNPATGSLVSLGGTGRVALDYQRRSVGIDFGEATAVSGLALVQDAVSGSRLTPADLSIWVSDDNAHWHQLTGWTIQGGALVFTLSGPSVTTRYIKVNQSYADNAWTFANNLDQILRPVVAAQAGYVEDPDPATGNLHSFGGTGRAAFDYQRRSIGLDFGTPTVVGGIALIENDTTGTRLKAADLSVWASDDNASDWRRLTGWTVQGGPVTGEASTFTVSGPPVTTRYIKVNQRYADSSWTFANNLDQLLRPISTVGVPQPFTQLGTTVLDPTSWHTIEFAVDTEHSQVGVSIDGTAVATLEQVHPAQVVTHFMAVAMGGDAGADLSVDELLVRDLSQGAPLVTGVTSSAAL
ncbi:MAG TPA: exo-alpha-sialidase [Gryllotalpicola sp.]